MLKIIIFYLTHINNNVTSAKFEEKEFSTNLPGKKMHLDL